MFLIDTDTCSALIAGHDSILQNAANFERGNWAISSVTAMELSYGAHLSRISKPKRLLVNAFLEDAPVVAFDRLAGLAAGKVRAVLQEAGRPTGPYDLLIAGHALSQNLILVTGNGKHFKHVQGLMVDDWFVRSPRGA